jgi:hypothetical protein
MYKAYLNELLMKKTFVFCFTFSVRKLVGAITATAIFVSVNGCEKKEDNVHCYECEMTYASGISAATQYPCTANIVQWQKEQIDNNGQQINSVCKEK